MHLLGCCTDVKIWSWGLKVGEPVYIKENKQIKVEARVGAEIGNIAQAMPLTACDIIIPPQRRFIIADVKRDLDFKASPCLLTIFPLSSITIYV